MTCRQADIGVAITSLVQSATGLEEQQVLSLYHEVMREGRDAAAPTARERHTLATQVLHHLNANTTFTSTRRRAMVARLDRSVAQEIDGRRYYATSRLMERAQRAEVAMTDYVAAAARDTGLSEDEVRRRIAETRARAGATRSMRPVAAGFVDAMRNDPTTRDLPLDRQTAVAIEAMEELRTRARAAQPTRPTVTRHPVDSSVIAEMGYDDATGRVEVVMHSNPGVPYAYRMTREEYNTWLCAPSVGSYYSRYVRGNDDYRYSDEQTAREAGTQTRCATCGEFADTSHACAPRGSAQEREETERRARSAATAARRPRRRVLTSDETQAPSDAAPAAAAPEQEEVRVPRRRVVLPDPADVEATPTRVGGRRRSYYGASGSFSTPSLTTSLAEARRNRAGVRIPVTSVISSYAGPSGVNTGLRDTGGVAGVVSGYALLTYNGRGRGYTVTTETPAGENPTTSNRLRCDCADYQRVYDCIHIRQTLQDLHTRANADRLSTNHGIGPAIEAVNTELAADHANSQTAQAASRTTWQPDPIYTRDHAAFQADYRAAKRRLEAGEEVIPYMTENATGGLGAPGTGRQFGVELEFVIDGPNRATALAAIGRELYAAGLTSTPRQQGYHSSSSYSTSHQGGWKFERDGTVDGEIISPIMSDTPETWAAIAKVCEIVERHGGTVNTSAGSHVHVSAGNYDHTVANHNRLMATFAENEDLIYRLSTNPTPSNRTRNHRGPSWCAPNRFPTGGYRDISDARRSNHSHHIGLNLQSMRGHASDHVEFRTFDGTLKPAVIQTQIKLALGITEAAFRDTDYQPGTHTPLGSHRAHNRAAHGQTRRLTGADWRQDVAGYKALADRIFVRPEDKAQLTALLASTRWQNRAA